MIWLRRLRQRLFPQAESARTTPAAASRAASSKAPSPRIRPLPMPFERFITINSDCDGSIHDLIHAAVALNTVIREEYGLPICDSFFGKWLFECGLDGVREPFSDRALDGSFERRVFFNRCGEWVRGFHRGWFDTTHGWVYNMSVRVAPDLAPDVNGAHVEFGPPPSWEEAAVPRYLAFRCADGGLDALSDLLLRKGDDMLVRWEAPAAQAIEIGDAPDGNLALPIPGPSSLTRWHGEEPLVLEARLMSADAVVRLAEVALVTEIRTDIARQLRALDDLNLAVTNFSSHAGGLVFATTDGQRRQFPAAAYYSDFPGSPHYCMDLFRAVGFETVQTFAQTSEYEVRSLDELAFQRTLADGTQVHDYHRYLYIPRRKDGSFDLSVFDVDGENLNPSWADTAAMQVAYCLEQTKSKLWHGAIIYTHLNYASTSHPFMREGVDARTICSAPLRDALAELARRYFGLSGCGNPADRVFIAPAGMLARMSAVSKLLDSHIDYEAAANAVRIRAAPDPVLGRKVPRREDGFRDLRGLSFYVEDAHTAHVTVDGEPVEGLIRNPADDCGRQSVTVVDMSAPVLVLGRVPAAERQLVIEAEGLELVAPDAQGEVHRVRLQANAGVLRVAGPLPALANRHYLLVEYEKSSPSLRFALELEDAGGQRLGWAEAGLHGSFHLPRRAAWTSVERRIDVSPFWQLCAECGATTPPVGRLARWQLVIEGNVEDSLVLHRVALLRDDGKRGGRTQCYIGGRLGSVPLTAVEVHSGEIREQAMLLRGGFYAVARPVPRGRIVRIEGRTEAGDIILPCGGGRHEIVDDDWEIDFPGSD